MSGDRRDEDALLRPIAPFWFWNGAMEPGEIERQIDEMHAQGVDAFIVCARQGLKVPYLSAAWFDRVRLAVARAKRLGMDVWLYDDQPYPSLAGGGRVALDHPEFEAKELRLSRRELRGGERVELDLDWGEILFARAYPTLGADDAAAVDWEAGIDIAGCAGQLFREEVFHETGLTAYNRKRFLACDPYLRLDWTAEGGPEARWTVYVFCQIPVRGHKYFDRFVDPLNPGAVSYFLQTTHERYAAELGEEFGKTVKGIFTDEIHPIGFEGDGIPWSPRMPALYRARWGEELLPLMPALVDDRFPGRARIRYRFMDALAEGFIESYDKPIAAWCRKRGIRFIGEKPILRSAQLRHFDVPGIDAGHQKAGGKPDALTERYRSNARVLSSAAHFYGKRRCLCESFHSIGWGLDIQDMKWTYDWLALQGVNLFVNHAYYYTTANLAKHDAPPSEFFQMPWWPWQRLLSAYVDELLRWTDAADRKPRILVLDTVSSRWTVSFADGAGRKAVGEDFARVLHALSDHHFDYWIVDSQLLAEARVSDGRILIGGEGFDCLVLPPARNLEDGAFQAARALLDAGGLVVACGGAPEEEVGAASSAELAGLWSRARAAETAEALPALLEGLGLREFSVADAESGTEAVDLQAMLYRPETGPRVFLLNPGAASRNVVVSIFGPGGRRLERRRALGPLESALVDFGAADEPAAAPVVELDVVRAYALRRESANVLRLDEWELSVEGDERKARVRAMPLVDQLASGGFRLPVRRRDRFGTPKTLLFSETTASYRYSFAANGLSGDLELRVEPEAVGGEWELSFNGRPLDRNGFTRKRIDGIELDALPLGAPLAGRNTIEIVVRAERSGDGLRASLHIAGDFSVSGSPDARVLRASETKGSPLDPGAAGLPYYSGHLVYEGSFTAAAVPEEASSAGIRLRIADDRWRSACSLSVNGRELGKRAWHPFEWTIPADLLRAEKNAFVLTAATDRLGYFEGQYYQAREDRYRSCEA